jgi:transcriptional regulator with PAS, ATPase and Fis domain
MIANLIDRAKKLAPTDIPILICGENGTGKELFADLLHDHSKRRTASFIKVNSSAFSETLLDNELFGHDKGAYTGADSTYRGVFENAHKGTLFLDEIGEMPVSLQTKILRTLQNNEIRRVGGSQIIKIDVRFIAATNKNITKLVDSKKFREDLFYRLSAAIIEIPPLRNRTEDIPLLVNYFLEEFRRTDGKAVKGVTPRVYKVFRNYRWPGNIRELRNTLKYSYILTSGDMIDVHDLPTMITSQDNRDPLPLRVLEQQEKETLQAALKQFSGNKKQAAEYLEISRSTLYQKIKRYAIES